MIRTSKAAKIRQRRAAKAAKIQPEAEKQPDADFAEAIDKPKQAAAKPKAKASSKKKAK